MEHRNLKTASVYINNQLLSRGLLRDGQNIDFVHPESSNHTAARIMEVVNDLILRRDRDAIQRENITDTVRMLRTDVLKLSAELERLREGKNDMNRKLAATEAEKKTLDSRLRTSESKERALKAEVEKLKGAVGQVRAMCAMDCRKREKDIEGLKKVISEGARVRGGRNSKIREIVIVGGVGEDHNVTASMSVDSEVYDLRSETNEFLTELARGLSEDNENLNGLLRRTLETLKTLSGWDPLHKSNTLTVEPSLEDLSEEMEAVVGHIRALLTNPSFVPLEELETREEEILRLRKGWEHMEQRWKDLVSMIDGWRKRIMHGGEIVNLEELNMGLRLDPIISSNEKPLAFNLSILQENDNENENENENGKEADICTKGECETHEANIFPEFGDEIDTDSSLFEENTFEDYCEEEKFIETELPEEKKEAVYIASSNLPKSSPHRSPLHETNSNRTSLYLSPKKQVGFSSPILEENTLDLLQVENSTFQETEADLECKQIHSCPKTSTSPSDNHDEVQSSKTSVQPPLFTSNSNSSNPMSIAGSKFPTKLQMPDLQNNKSPATNSTPKSGKRYCSPSSQRMISPSNSRFTVKNASLPMSCAPKSPKYDETPKLKLGPDCRLPRPRNVAPQQSPLTMAHIAEKLAASEREANAARVRAKLRAARSGKISSTTSNKRHSPSIEEKEIKPPTSAATSVITKNFYSERCHDSHTDIYVDEYRYLENYTQDGRQESILEPPDKIGSPINTQRDRQSRKRKEKELGYSRETGKSRRRRSTLSPWEFEKVIRGEIPIES